ncbi:nuclear protein localization protein 4 [Sorochytrium milnesiophthora]
MPLIRLRTRDGTSRIEVSPHDSIGAIAQKLSMSPAEFSLARDPSGKDKLDGNERASIEQLGIRHGDMVCVLYQPRVQPADSAGAHAEASPAATVAQDPVDDFLEKQTGLITRKKDPAFCKHGDKGMCEYCSPLEPFDAQYLESNKIKHMSFHAYIRQLTAQNRTAQSGGAFVHPLEEPNYMVKQPCSSGHAPWPLGICSKCQPSAVTLQRQTFRMVDHVEFESPALVEDFLRFWRSTGFQRFGWLYGRFEPYAEVPLGVKAVVSAIYEPPQDNAMDGLEIMHVQGAALQHQQRTSDAAAELAMADETAAHCGLTMVGMIFTDLIDDGSGAGTVHCKRHAKSYFLSSLEAIFAAHMQRQRPTASKLSSTGTFGSRFVTCIVSGNKEGGIEIEAYQVSNTAVALADAGLVEASIEPSSMRVKEASDTLYVPDVMYKFKNEYNVTVQQNAKPTFPVDYLLVNVTHGFPTTPVSLFRSKSRYAIENRPSLEPQDLPSLGRQIQNGTALENVSNFHALLHIHKLQILSAQEFQQLCQTVVRQGTGNSLPNSGGWQTLLALLREQGAHAFV